MAVSPASPSDPALRPLAPLTQDQVLAEKSVIDALGRGLQQRLGDLERGCPELRGVSEALRPLLDPDSTMVSHGRVDLCREGRAVLERMLRAVCRCRVQRWSSQWSLSRMVEALEPVLGPGAAAALRSAKDIANAASHAPVGRQAPEFDLRYLRAFLYSFQTSLEAVIAEIETAPKHRARQLQRVVCHRSQGAMTSA
eukprot:m51a1_g3995 hypothetical protein (197) ;mRNA; f:504839-505429